MKTAILVDGGFYRKIAAQKFGIKKGEAAADELISYCNRHLKEKVYGRNIYHDLYRVFYYDCPPISTPVYHPLLKKNINLAKSDTYVWMTEFLKRLTRKRKVALRLGELSESRAHYNLRYEVLKAIMNGSKALEDLKEEDFELVIEQKAVDMKIGVDIASLCYKRQVDQIVLISGDSDFVPASKLARREGIDFVLDSMGRKIKDDLFEHIDGLKYRDSRLKVVNTPQMDDDEEDED